MQSTIIFLYFHLSSSAALRLNQQTWAPKILFGIETTNSEKYKVRLDAQMNTWLRDLTKNEIVIVGRSAPKGMENRAQWEAANQCDDAVVTCKEMTMVEFAANSDADWLLILGEDNYVIPEAVKQNLQTYDPNEPLMLGIPGCATQNCSGMCGGAGQFLSRGALKLMVKEQHTFENNYKAYASKCDGYGDQTTSMAAKQAGVQLTNMKGNTIYGWKKTTVEIKSILADLSAMLFHYVDADQMYEINSLVKRRNTLSDIPASVFFKTDSLAWNKAYNAERARYIQDLNSHMYSKTWAI